MHEFLFPEFHVLYSDPANFENLSRFCDEMKDAHAHMIPIIDAGVKEKKGYEVCDEGLENGYFCTYEDGKPFVGAISDMTRAIITVKPDSKPRALCVACGKCVEVCPVGLVPRDILSVKKNTLSRYCIECGCCEFVCPSGIPLVKLIKNNAEAVVDDENDDTEVE